MEPLDLQYGSPTRQDQIFERFVQFHRENPAIWRLFRLFTFNRIKRGFKRYSARGIAARVRFETDLPTQDDTGFKLNDHYTPYYARMFAVRYPNHGDFFRMRELVSAHHSPSEHELTPESFTMLDEVEENIRTKLAKIIREDDT